jgi:Pyridoxamine 5'-phosphate oxidase
MIPERVVEVFRGPAFMHVGTRDADLRPAHAFPLGVVIGDDRVTVTFFVNEWRSKRVLSDLENNGRVAFAGGLMSHEAYQLKGVYLSSRPATDDEIAFQEAHRAKLGAELSQWFPKEVIEGLFLRLACRPSVAITFRVEEVFLQTPGPGAGTKIA